MNKIQKIASYGFVITIALAAMLHFLLNGIGKIIAPFALIWVTIYFLGMVMKKK